MKYYDKRGNIHKSLLRSYWSDVKDKFDKGITNISGYISNTENTESVDIKQYEEISEDGEEVQLEEIPEPSIKDFERIVHDYAHNSIIVYGSDGSEQMRVNMDDSLSKNTIESELASVLFPDGKIPDDFIIGNTNSKLEDKPPEIGNYQCKCGNITRYSVPKEIPKCDKCGMVIECDVCGTSPIYEITDSEQSHG